jgi:hypothetical protein
VHAGYLFGLGVRYLLEARSTQSPRPVRTTASTNRSAQTTPLA